MHTRNRHRTRKRLTAPRRISPERLRKSHIFPEAVPAGMFPEAGGTLVTARMGPRAAATGATAMTGTMADGNRPGNGRLGSEVRRADPSEPRMIYVQPK
jgi:hypothetical protein